MKWNRGAPPVGVPELAMRTVLPNFLKAQTQQERRYFAWFQNGQ